MSDEEQYYDRDQPADETEWHEPYDGYAFDGPVLEYRGVLYE